MYVGQTVSFGIRMSAHARKLRSGKHHCAPLQYSWNKHGGDQFTFSLVIRADSDLSRKEQMVVDMFRKRDGVYNVGDCVDPPMRGRLRPDNAVTRSKNPEIVKKLHAGFRKWLDSDASIEWRKRNAYKIKAARVVARQDPTIEARRKKNQREAAQTAEYREKQRVIMTKRLADGWEPQKKLRKPVECMITGLTWDSLKACASALSLSPCRITRAIGGSKGQPLGHLLKFVGEDCHNTNMCQASGRYRRVVNTATGEVFDSVSAAARQCGFKDPSRLSNILHGHRPHTEETICLKLL